MRFHAACAFVLLLASTLALAAPARAGVLVEPTITEGRELVYELGFELERGLVMGAGRDRLVQQAGVRLTIESIDDEGVATVRGGFDWVVLDLDRAAFRVRVDSRDIVGDSPNLAETTIREMIQLYLDDEFTLRVSPEGRVLEATGLEGISAKLADSPGSLPRLAAGRFVPETLAEDLEPIWSADGAAGKTIAEGDSWTATRASPLGAGVGLNVRTDWSATAVTESQVAMEGDVTAEITLPETEQQLEVVFEVTEQEGSSSAVWSRNTGAMFEREAFLSYTVTVSVGEQSQSSQRNGRSTLQFKSASDGE